MCYFWVLSVSEKKTFPRALFRGKTHPMVAGARLREAKKKWCYFFLELDVFFVQILTNSCETFFSRPKGEPFFFLGTMSLGLSVPGGVFSVPGGVFSVPGCLWDMPIRCLTTRGGANMSRGNFNSSIDV